MSDNPTMVVRVAANIDELRKNLAEGTGLIETTTAGMQKLAGSLDGSKLEQRAHNIVAAITDIGGTSKLSDQEASRLLNTLNGWIEKGERTGKTIPPAMRAARDELAKMVPPLNDATSKFDQIWAGLKGAAGLIGVAFSAQAVVGFVGHVFDAASQ